MRRNPEAILHFLLSGSIFFVGLNTVSFLENVFGVAAC